MAITHDGTAIDGLRTGRTRALLRWAAVINRPTGPTAPLGMVRRQVVAHFVGHDVDGPGVGWEVLISRVDAAESIIETRKAQHVDVCNTAQATAAQTHQMRQIARKTGSI